MSEWFARTYDVLYEVKNYEEEAERIATLVQQRLPVAATLLDVACGTGRHLEYLRRQFSCMGVDISPDFVAIAEQRLPDVAVRQADMAELALGRTFDAVICLFSAIGYMETRPNLFRAVAAMARHLNPGGVLIVEPWILPENWRPGGTTYVHMGEVGEDKVVRVSATSRSGDVSVLDFHYVWASPGHITSGDEQHRLGLFSREDYLDACASAGLAAAWEDEGLIDRGLVVGRRH